jgi:hypothetical protein
LLDLLVEHRVIEDDAYVDAIEARWDRMVPAGRVFLEVNTSTAPAERIGVATRRKSIDATAERFVSASKGNRRLHQRHRHNPVAKVSL